MGSIRAMGSVRSKRSARAIRSRWLGFVGVVLVAAAPVAASELGRRLEKLVAAKPLDRAAVGLLVVRARDGAVLHERGADQLFVPASNQKILTVIASLDRFGPAHRFTTRVHAPQPIDGEGEVAELLVEGGGDPAMSSEDWWRLAADLRREGLRTVRGDVRVDDALFDGPAWHPSWGDVSANAYHAPIGALTANFGAFAVTVWPRAAAGSQARVVVDPPVAYLRLRNLARTAPRRSSPSLLVDRLPGPAGAGYAEEIVRVEGRVRRGDPGDRLMRGVLDPGLYAGSLLRHQLEANGVEVEGVVRRAPRGEEPFSLILERPGRSLAEIARLCLKQSSNAVAETLIKDLDAFDGSVDAARPTRRGDWAGGVRVARAALEGLGIDLAAARLVDGSGLSLQNRISPRMLVAALRVAQDSFRFGPELVGALPIAFRDGTLEKRLEGAAGRIRAKTGLLSDAGVSALSGYADREDGERLIFSILVNGAGGDAERVIDAVDRLAQTLLDAPLPAELPSPRPPAKQPAEEPVQADRSR